MEGPAVDHAPMARGRYHAAIFEKIAAALTCGKLRAVRNVAAGIEKPREGSRCWVIRGQPARGAEPLAERVRGTRAAMHHFGALLPYGSSRALRTAQCVVPSAASPRSSDSLLRSQLGLAGGARWRSLPALALPAVRSFPQKPLVPRASCSSHSPVLRPDRSLTHRWAALGRIDHRSFLALRIPLFFTSHFKWIPPQHEIKFYAPQNQP